MKNLRQEIINAILNDSITEYDGIELPTPQRCGTYYQRKTYAEIEADKFIEDNKLSWIK